MNSNHNRTGRRMNRLLTAKKMTGFDKAVFLQSRKIVYYQRELRMCTCGCRPYIEKELHSSRALWIIRCPGCGLRIRKPGIYSSARNQWNNSDFSPDSVMLTRKLERIDDFGMIALYEAIFGDAEEGELHA